MQLNSQKPREIHRSVRKLNDLKYWKGTEFRSFLLYFGVVVLKRFLPEEVYNHFLILICAVTICYSEAYVDNLLIAKMYFDKFVDGCIHLYGVHYLVSNNHNLTHVVDDVKRFGNLSTISAYPFENRLNFIKLRLKQMKLPLEQITRRIVELSLDYEQLYGLNSTKKSFPELKCSSMVDGVEVYKLIIQSDYTLSANRKADRWFMTRSREIVQMHYAINTPAGILILGARIMQKDDFFKQPMSSRFLNIFKSDGELEPDLVSFELTEILAKMICIADDNNIVFLPLLHTLKKE